MDEFNSDADLVRAARRRDRVAAGALLQRHRPLLVGPCRRMLGDGDLAEDAAQEACVTAMVALDRLRDPARFGPWLGGIGLNVCRRWLRARSEATWSWEAVQGGTLATAPEVAAALAAPDPHELLELRELGERVWQAVAALPDGQRAAVWRFHFAGLTHDEIAAELGTSVAAVKTRLHKGRARLRRDLWQVWREEMAMTAGRTDAGGDLVEMRVTDVRKVPSSEQPDRSVVLLEEAGGARRLVIWVGPVEAVALALGLTGTELPRPRTYEFTASLLRAVGAQVREVRVERLTEGTFYATVVVEGGDGSVEVDARPSDAFNLALLMGAPIRVRSKVIHRADSEQSEHHPELPSAQVLAAEGTTGARQFVEEDQEQLRQARAAMQSTHWRHDPE